MTLWAALLLGTLTAADTPAVAITFLDVGQGDATLIESPDGKRALVDAGPQFPYGPGHMSQPAFEETISSSRYAPRLSFRVPSYSSRLNGDRGPRGTAP